LPLVPFDIRKTIEYHGDGGQAFIAPNAGLRSVDNKWNVTLGKQIALFGVPVPLSGTARGVDPVPALATFANPLKLFGIPFLLSGGEVEIIRTESGSDTLRPVSGNDHSWASFYNWQY